jgi:hypothetical protein
VQFTAAAQTFTLSGLAVNSGSTLDLTTNTLLISYGSTDPISAIQSYLASGYSSGWVTGQIISSTVAALNASQNNLIYDVGYADGADGITSVPSGEIEIVPTLAGDAKLQGNVVFGDFQLLAQFFGQPGTWDEGNFTYGPSVNFGDFQLLAQNFSANSGALTASEVASLDNFAEAFGEVLQPNPDGVGFILTSVPEPASAGLLAAAGAGLLVRRRRKR